jgi:hypothetical protein
MWYVSTLVSTTLLALILAAIAGGLYNRPKLIFTGG